MGIGMKIDKNDPITGKKEATNKNKDTTPPPSIISLTGFLIFILVTGLDLISLIMEGDKRNGHVH